MQPKQSKILSQWSLKMKEKCAVIIQECSLYQNINLGTDTHTYCI